MRILLMILTLSFTYGQTIQISVDRNQLTEDDLVTLSIEVTESKGFPQVDMNQVSKDFEIASGPGQQTNIQWINGKMTSTKTLTWTLSPKRGGILVIPALSGTVGIGNIAGVAIAISIGGPGAVFWNGSGLFVRVFRSRSTSQTKKGPKERNKS